MLNDAPRFLNVFSETARTVVNSDVKQWKDQGGKVMGYLSMAMNDIRIEEKP